MGFSMFDPHPEDHGQAQPNNESDPDEPKQGELSLVVGDRDEFLRQHGVKETEWHCSYRSGQWPLRIGLVRRLRE